MKLIQRIAPAPLLAALFTGAVLQAVAGVPDRAIPLPLPSHPGNIFVAGETAVIPAPTGISNEWSAVDYEGKTVAKGSVENGSLRLGQLPVGYYEIFSGTDTDKRQTTVAVIESLRAPTPRHSPVGIDVALSWCFPPAQWPGAISLCQLAGMNRVRDRLSWPEMEPQRGQMASSNRYDAALDAQDAGGLQVLDVNHISPTWANPDGKRMPLDLRDAYNFYRALAQRWHGKIAAIEPWNEADIIEFGGHTGDEMASLQKAAYLGLKAGNPDLTVCENVFAIRRLTTLRNFNENQAWPYFDTFNLHHYEPFTNYPKMYEDFRSVSAGRPLWVTECSWTVQWTGDENLKEPDAENTRIQSERVPKTYALAIHEGAKAVFFFMLPHYSERKIQYGLLHPDLTPRPGYLALAATGRLLADAQPLGRVDTTNKSIAGYLFRARPDGHQKDVLVIWSDSDSSFELPKPPVAAFDHLGRVLKVNGNSLALTTAPQFILLAEESRPALTPPPKSPPWSAGKPGSIVMQALEPVDSVDMKRSGYKMAVGSTNSVPIYLYNFGPEKVHGELHVTVPKDWTVDFPNEVEIAPGEREELTLALASAKSWDMAARVEIKGDFGPRSKALLALRFFSGTP